MHTLLDCLLACCVAGLGGCGRRQEVKMIDPRTGVAAYCHSDRYNLSATVAALQPLQGCLNELAFYGFRDEDWLRQVARPAAPPSRPLPSPQPLPWLPPEGQRGPSPPAYAPPVYSGPLSPGY
jgi:hypothetical protein